MKYLKNTLSKSKKLKLKIKELGEVTWRLLKFKLQASRLDHRKAWRLPEKMKVRRASSAILAAVVLTEKKKKKTRWWWRAGEDQTESKESWWRWTDRDAGREEKERRKTRKTKKKRKEKNRERRNSLRRKKLVNYQFSPWSFITF